MIHIEFDGTHDIILCVCFCFIRVLGFLSFFLCLFHVPVRFTSCMKTTICFFRLCCFNKGFIVCTCVSRDDVDCVVSLIPVRTVRTFLERERANYCVISLMSVCGVRVFLDQTCRLCRFTNACLWRAHVSSAVLSFH